MNCIFKNIKRFLSMLRRNDTQGYKIITENILINDKGEARLSYPAQGTIVFNSAEIVISPNELLSVRVKLEEDNKINFSGEFVGHMAIVSYLVKVTI